MSLLTKTKSLPVEPSTEMKETREDHLVLEKVDLDPEREGEVSTVADL